MKSVLFKNFIIFLLIFVFITSLFSLYNSSANKKPEVIGLNKLVELVNNEQVKKIEVDGEKVAVTLTDDSQKITQKEPNESLSTLLDNFKVDVIRTLSIIQIQNQQDIERAEEQRRHVFSHNMQFQHPEIKEEAEGKVIPFQKRDQKVGRNEPCPCGSGKKFKHCHGQI